MNFSRLLRHRAPALAKSALFTGFVPALGLLALANTARAQEAPPTGAAATPARAGRQETLRQITDRLTQTTGVRVLADSGLSSQMLSAPREAVTAQTLDDHLTRLTRRLPAGTVALKVYLPPAGAGRRFTPDSVALLARAQLELLGRPAPNTVQIQGKTLSATEAAPILRTLGLEPVYVLTNRQGPGMPRFGAESSNAMMDALTKQLGVPSVADIPPGTYKVTVPGPDGTPREATVEVESSEGKRRIMVRMGDLNAR
ncbi:MAG: hypothetical protein V4671_01055 [Armatimonadota bacterium]